MCFNISLSLDELFVQETTSVCLIGGQNFSLRGNKY
jgi:hypothetical protein